MVNFKIEFLKCKLSIIIIGIVRMLCCFVYKNGQECQLELLQSSKSYCYRHVIHEDWWPNCSQCEKTKVAWYSYQLLCHNCIKQKVNKITEDEIKVNELKNDDQFPPLTSVKQPSVDVKKWTIPLNLKKESSEFDSNSMDKVKEICVRNYLNPADLTMETIDASVLNSEDRSNLIKLLGL